MVFHKVTCCTLLCSLDMINAFSQEQIFRVGERNNRSECSPTYIHFPDIVFFDRNLMQNYQESNTLGHFLLTRRPFLP